MISAYLGATSRAPSSRKSYLTLDSTPENTKSNRYINTKK